MIIKRTDGTEIDTDRLRGGGNPDDELDQNDPRSLAAQIPRERYGRTHNTDDNAGTYTDLWS